MSKKDQMKTPMGAAGLVRYEEGDESKLKMSPKTVIFIAVGVIILEIIMFTMF